MLPWKAFGGQGGFPAFSDNNISPFLLDRHEGGVTIYFLRPAGILQDCIRILLEEYIHV